MSKQEKNFQKFPKKTITLSDGATVEFKKLDGDFPSKIFHYPQTGGYQELYPSVYSIEIPGEGFTKLYDFFVEEYFENLGLINYEQFNLYNYITTLRNRGYYLSLSGRKLEKGKPSDADVKGLAQMIRSRVKALTANIDHLEDCLLLHRVRRLDLQGMPNELVIHSPFTKKQLDAGKHKIILDRISRQHTKTQRQKAVHTGDGKTGKFGYLDRKATNERFQMNYQFIKNAFGDNAAQFADFALGFFKSHLGFLRRSKSEFDYAYRAELKKKLSFWAIAGNSAREACYIAANKFRVIYCPTFEELCA